MPRRIIFTISIAFLLCTTHSGLAQQVGEKEESRQDPHQEAIVDCAKVGVRSAKSKVFASPDCKSSAYVETIAETLPNGGLRQSIQPLFEIRWSVGFPARGSPKSRGDATRKQVYIHRLVTRLALHLI